MGGREEEERKGYWGEEKRIEEDWNENRKEDKGLEEYSIIYNSNV